MNKKVVITAVIMIDIYIIQTVDLKMLILTPKANDGRIKGGSKDYPYTHVRIKGKQNT